MSDTLERLREEAVCLADNAEAYLDLEERGERNYPDSLRLAIQGLRDALASLDTAGGAER